MSSSDEVTAATTADGAGGCEKTRWPETVGLCVEEAKKIILKDMPHAKIVVLPVGAGTTKDIRPDRVRIFVDIVAEVPRVG